MSNYALIKWTTQSKCKFLEKFKLPRMYQDEIEIINKQITNIEIETVINNLPKKIKAQDRMASQLNLSNTQGKTNPCPSEILLKNCKLNLQRLSHPHNKIGQICHIQKTKASANNIDEHRFKNPQQIQSEPDSTTH